MAQDQEKLSQADLEQAVLATLKGFASLRFETLNELVLKRCGRYTWANEQLLKKALESMWSDGRILSPASEWGPYMLPMPPQPSKPSPKGGRSKPHWRLRSGTAG